MSQENVRYTRASAVRGRDALVAQAGLFEFERTGRQAELQVRRAVEPRPDVLQVLLEVPERERHGRNPKVPLLGRRSVYVRAPRRADSNETRPDLRRKADLSPCRRTRGSEPRDVGSDTGYTDRGHIGELLNQPRSQGAVPSAEFGRL